MAEAILDIRLDTVQPNRVRLIYGVQNDYNSRYLCVRFTVNGKPIDIESVAAVRINAKRPDGNKDAFPGTVNTDGTVKVPVAQWMLEVPGEVSASVTAVTSNSALTTQDFYIMAKLSNWDGTDVPSEEDPDKDVIETIIVSENERIEAERAREERFAEMEERFEHWDNSVLPSASVTQTDEGATINLKDKNGATTATVKSAYGAAKDGGYTGTEAQFAEDINPDNIKAKATPKKNVDYFDGTSVTISSVTESTASGGANTVTFSDGKKINIKNGITPVAGVDYMSKEEAEAYIATELAKRGQLKPENAQSLEWLEANGDTSKFYVMTDKTSPDFGYIFAYMLTEKEVESGGYTNILDTYAPIINKRWSYSSKALSTANGYIAVTNIPVKPEDIIRVNEENIAGNPFFRGGYSRIHYLDANGNYVSGTNDRAPYRDEKLTVEDGVTSWVVGYVNATDNDPSTNTKLAGYDNITQMIAVFAIEEGVEITEADVAGYIMTINQEIKAGSTEIIKEYAWTNTGLNITPADYEPRIIKLENKSAEHTTKIIALEKAVNSGSIDETEAQALARIKEWDKPIYDHAEVTLISDDRVKPALTTEDRTIDAIYAKYRALMAEHPKYITETNMGACTASDTFTAVDMLRFDFKEPDGLTQPDLGASALHETKPTIIFLSGIHAEWVGVWGLYYALEEIAMNPEFDDIRRNAHIVVIPCANPYCLAWETSIDGWRMSHVNANGVAIHNNFGVDHSTSGSVGEYNYGGTAPCSELETQYIDAVMAEYPNAIAFVSCHNNDYSTYYGSHVIWASSATYHMCNMAFRLIDKLSKAWIDKYGDVLKTAIDNYKINMDANDYRLGRATMSSSKGTEQKNATKYGIQGVNLEIARMMKVFSGNTDGTSEVMTHGAEVYANFMRTLLAAYDYKDKKDYAPNLPWKE